MCARVCISSCLPQHAARRAACARDCARAFAKARARAGACQAGGWRVIQCSAPVARGPFNHSLAPRAAARRQRVQRRRVSGSFTRPAAAPPRTNTRHTSAQKPHSLTA
eukprot:11741719-Alexandrium_andersonii.AAC.1